MKKLTKFQYAIAYAVSCGTVAVKIAPYIFAVLAYHYFGVPGLLLVALGWCMSESISELHQAIERAEMHARAMQMMKDVVDKMEKERNGGEK